MAAVPEHFSTIYKYTDIIAAKKILESGTLLFQNPRRFNDPFDCDIAGVSFDVEDLGMHATKDLQQLYQMFPTLKDNQHLIGSGFHSSVMDKVDRCAVTCFSLDSNNPIMWAHYAASMTGFCFKFDNGLKRRFDMLTPDVEGVVLYGITGEVNYMQNRIEGLTQIFLTKHRCWEYEREYRYVTLKGEGCYRFRPEFLRAIFIGLRASEEDIRSVINLAKLKHQHLTFFKAVKESNQIHYTEVGS